MKTQKLLLIPIMLIFLVSLITIVNASSVTISLFYESTTSNSLTITNGDSTGVIVSADSIFEPSMTIKLDLLDYRGDVLMNVLDTYTISDSYSKSLTVGQSAYSGAGDYTLKATVTSSSGQTATDTLSLKVLAVSATNHLPVITSTPITQINEGQNYNYQVSATDADGDALTYSLTQNPSWLSINSNGLISGTAPQVNADYPYAVTVKVSDGKNFTTQYYTLTVKDVAVPPVNHLPVITSTPITSVNEGQIYSYQIKATDADGDTLTYSLTSGPTWLLMHNNILDGIAPDVNSDTTYSITLKVSDGKNFVTQSFTLTVKNIPVITNHAPVITSTPVLQVNEGQIYDYLVTATDSDNDNLVYIFEQGPPWLSINIARHIIGTAPLVASDTPYTITIKVDDGKGGIATQNFIMTVKNIPVVTNNVPVITSTPITQINEGQAYIYQVVATDADGNVLTYSLKENPSWLSMSSQGKITGTAPQVNSDSQYPIEISVSDGKDSVTQIFAITVKDTSIPGDTTAPSITIISPINGQTYTSSIVLLEMTTDEDVTSAWYVIDNSASMPFDRVAHSYSHFIDEVSVGDGTHTITFYARDAAENLGQTPTITFYVDTSVPDTTAPVVTISSPVNGVIYTSHRTQITFTATDANLNHCQYSLNGGPRLGTACNVPITGITSVEGTNTWTVYATDDAGNTGSASVTFTVNTSSGGTTNRGNNNIARHISDSDGTKQYLEQFEPITITEDEEVLGKETVTAFGGTLLALVIGGLLFLIVAFIILWIRR